MKARVRLDEELNAVERADNFSSADGLIKYEEWEERVFLASIKYSVNIPLGRGKVDTKWYRTYPEAMLIAMHTPRGILYATTQSGRSVCITRKDYEKYLGVYNKATGQNLQMPRDPLKQEAVRTHKRSRVRVRL
jgi:hypothetical protein